MHLPSGLSALRLVRLYQAEHLCPLYNYIIYGLVDSVEWNGGMVEWNGAMEGNFTW